MYSAVLMLALTAGTESVDHGNRGGCVGSGSCQGVVVGSGCVGSGGCRGGLFHGRSSGCTGTVVSSSGCVGSSSGCVGSRGHGCNGGGLFGRFRNRGGCCGTVVSTGCVGSAGCVGTVVTPATPAKVMPKPETAPVPVKKPGQVSAPANIIVNLPANARLSFDGAQTNSISDRRTFVTPALEVGTTFTYTVRAEIVTDGQTVAQSQTVNVRGGQTSTVQFTFPSQTVASR